MKRAEIVTCKEDACGLTSSKDVGAAWRNLFSFGLKLSVSESLVKSDAHIAPEDYMPDFTNRPQEGCRLSRKIWQTVVKSASKMSAKVFMVNYSEVT